LEQLAPAVYLKGRTWTAGASAEYPCRIAPVSLASEWQGLAIECQATSGTWGNAFKFDMRRSDGSLSVTVGNNTNSIALNGSVSHPNSHFTVNDTFRVVPTSTTIADDGAGTEASLTLTPTTANHSVTCNDTNNCSITLSEVGASPGEEIEICNPNATRYLRFPHSNGVQELHNGVTGSNTYLHSGKNECIKFIYINDTWAQSAPVAHNHAMDSYCSLYEENEGGTTIDVTVAGTYVQWTTSTVNLESATPSELCDADTTTDRITIGTNGAGIYMINTALSVAPSAASPQIDFAVFKNGTRVSACTGDFDTADRERGAIPCQLSLAVSDYIDVRLTSSNNAQDPVVHHLTFNAQRIAY
jgi:hypothetical protein